MVLPQPELVAPARRANRPLHGGGGGFDPGRLAPRGPTGRDSGPAGVAGVFPGARGLGGGSASRWRPTRGERLASPAWWLAPDPRSEADPSATRADGPRLHCLTRQGTASQLTDAASGSASGRQ